MIILVPLPLFFASTVYGVAGFTTWVIVSIIWTFLSATTVVLYPLYESRTAIIRIFVGIVKVRCVISQVYTGLNLLRIIGHFWKRCRQVSS
jgi:hypothetical protein